MLGVSKRPKMGPLEEEDSAVPIKVGSLFGEFLEPLFHHCLHLQKMYPPKYFQEAQAYGVPLRRCFHPLVVSYVATACNSCQKWIDDGSLDRISCVFFDEFGDKTVSVSVKFSRGQVHATQEDALYLKNYFRESLFLLEHRLQGAPKSHTYQIEMTCAGPLADNVDWVLVDREEDSEAQVVPVKSLGSIKCVGSEIFVKMF